MLTDLKTFLDASLTSWHAVQEIGNRLALREFQPLNEEEKWTLEPGQRYFVVREGSLCAFTVPKRKPRSALLLASHTDSPALKLKPVPSYQTEHYLQLSTEIYGAPLLSSWLNRDLTLAGRIVILSEKGEREERLVHIDDAIAFIPQLAIHLDREVNEKGLLLNKQEHLNPIWGLSEGQATPKEAFEILLRRHLPFLSLLSHELFLVSAEPARFVGCQHEMLASSRIDNLVSAHAALCALCALESLETPAEDRLQIALFFDHEEIGSGSRQGADSVFLADQIQRICLSLQLDPEEQILLKNRSLCVSLDMAHALNPNYPKKHDPRHAPLLSKGVVIKHNANQKYASNASSTAPIVAACHALHLPYQSYAPSADLPCGSTVGPLISKQTGIATVDIGCPQLSMHSVREVVATKDYLDLVLLLTHLLKEG